MTIGHLHRRQNHPSFPFQPTAAIFPSCFLFFAGSSCCVSCSFPCSTSPTPPNRSTAKTPGRTVIGMDSLSMQWPALQLHPDCRGCTLADRSRSSNPATLGPLPSRSRSVSGTTVTFGRYGISSRARRTRFCLHSFSTARATSFPFHPRTFVTVPTTCASFAPCRLGSASGPGTQDAGVVTSTRTRLPRASGSLGGIVTA
ncbi:hypothetical protein OH76DRAFT_815083 [Lentinus brumalis]|uniref:Uncharacterized protein n=1 Tax=Lentinus brumalis TaxID=2498619 RepID=A0A371D2J4_9APHY|nr:hypothetical protein OH76DRAFT_815083 [Polyporus brumalis]